MKKHLIAALTIIMIAIIAVTLVACEKTDANGLIILKTPNPTVNGNTVTWNAVKNAVKYGVVIGENEEFTVNGTSYVVDDGGRTEIKVRAIGDLVKYGYSEYSSPVAVTVSGKLATPIMNDIKINDDGSATFTWSEIDGARAYRFNLSTANDKDLVSEELTGTSYTVSADTISAPAYYNYRVMAYSGSELRDSSWSAVKTYQKGGQLETPQDVRQLDGSNGESYFRRIEFSAVKDADKYILEAYNNEKSFKLEKSIASGTVTFDLSELETDPGEYDVRVKAVSVNNNLLKDSEYAAVKNYKGENLKLKKHAKPTGIILNGSAVSWSKAGEGLSYVLDYSSDKNTQTTDSTTETSFDLATASSISNSNLAGLLVDVKIYVAADYEKGILKGEESKPVKYAHTEKPLKVEEGKYAGYYAVDKISKLNYIAVEPNANYLITKNIDCGNGIMLQIAKNFGGILEGDNFSINRFTLTLGENDGSTFYSLFGTISGSGAVKNLGLFNVTISDKENALRTSAILANVNEGSVENVTVKAKIDAGNTVGGIINTNKGKIENAFFTGELTGKNTLGGIAAINELNAVITNARVFSSSFTSSSGANYTEHVYMGGIAGINSGKIEYAGVEGTNLNLITAVQDKNAYLGGITGRNAGEIDYAYLNATNKTLQAKTDAAGNVSKAYIGGISGVLASGKINSAYAINGAYKLANFAATLVGYSFGASSISDSYSSNVTLASIDKYIVVSEYTDTLELRNLYYYNTNKELPLSSTAMPDGRIKNVERRDDMNDKNIVNIASMTPNISVQVGGMVLKDMPYFKAQDSFSSTLKRADIKDRAAADVLVGNAVIKPSFSFNESGLITNMTVYDIYSHTLESGRVLTLNRIFTIS